MRNKLENQLRAHIFRKTRIVIIGLLVFLLLQSFWWFTLYAILRGNYHNESINTLYTITGKCGDISIVDLTYSSMSTIYYRFTINDEVFLLNSDNVTHYSENLITNCLASDSITIQYVSDVWGINRAQSLKLSDGTVYSDIEAVINKNNKNIIAGYIIFPTVSIITTFLIGIYFYYLICRDKSVSKTIRKLRRKRARQKLFSDKGI